ncbi:MAG: hypothetical protein U1F54_08185 [Burkholderiales bacterium]
MRRGRGVSGRMAAVIAALAALAALAAPAAAEVCKGVPDCVPQEMAPVKFGPLDTKGWAFYCKGDHPYYWNTDSVLGLFGFNYSHTNNRCFTVTENGFAEKDPGSKFDATITNWCLRHETIKVTIGCSSVPSSVPATCANKGPVRIIKDPHCPVASGTVKNYCSGGPVPACIQTWQENCESGPAYCTADVTLTWCYACPK